MAESPSIASILKQLNPAQLQAVKTIEGPVMVIAGPGTGKTQVLAARIAYILQQTDTNPGSVLALTFTESAAQNMRKRLVSMVGKTGYYVQIHTFHSFCTEIIATHPEYFPIDRESQPLSELERFQLFENLIETLPLKVLKPLNAPYLYLRDLIGAISDLKREGVTVTALKELIQLEKEAYENDKDSLKKTELVKKQKHIAKNEELILVYTAYQQSLLDTRRYDFDDMITLVLQALQEQEELLLENQERFLYFLVDEYQDTNTAQNKIVDLLASFWSDQPNIFVVGDPNQAIYRFQGASLENVLSFTQRYPQAEVITLKQGFRSPQKLYEAAATLIKESHQEDSITSAPPAWLSELSKPLQSTINEEHPVSLLIAPSQTIESVMIVETIQDLIHTGVPAEEIAILYRNNSDATDIVQALDKWGINYNVDGGSNILDEDYICQLLDLLRVIVAIRQGQEAHELYTVLQLSWWNINPVLIMKLARAASKAKLSLFDLMQHGFENFKQYHLVDDVTELEFSVVKKVVDQIIEWGARDATTPLNTWLEQLMNESGYLQWILTQPTKVEMVNGINALFREVQKSVTQATSTHVADFLQMIETLQKHHLQLTLEDLNVTTAAVHVSTVHKAKGREWQYVFLIKCLDGKWGNTRAHNLITLPEGILKQTDVSALERNADDRRLFYVALTRAKKQCIISYPETIVQDNRSKIGMASLFLTEIESYLNTFSSPLLDKIMQSPEESVIRLLQPAPPLNIEEKDKAYFKELVKDFPLSISALNTYLQSPTDFRNQYLLRVPTAQSPQLAFGTAVHLTLERAVKQFMQSDKWLTVEEFIHTFGERLLQEPLDQNDYQARLLRGKEVLPLFYKELIESKVQPLFVERFFGRGATRAILDDITLTGRLDRVDWVDKEQETVKIIDYKTGKPRTLGEIEGTTASAGLTEREAALPEGIRGRYKRQLVFYALLAELDPTFKPRVTNGEFHFVEPDSQSGKIITRSLPIHKNEIEDLKALIKEVMQEIRTLQFLEEYI